MKRIPLTQGKFAIVDDEDYDWLMQWKWFAHKEKNTYIACRNTYLGRGRKPPKRTMIRMHQEIMGAQLNQQIDHRNHNALDNRKQNLRFCTLSQNAQNTKKLKNCSSIYKGVDWHKHKKKWQARTRFYGKRHFLGYFNNELAAAHAYDEKARELFGEFAYTNF